MYSVEKLIVAKSVMSSSVTRLPQSQLAIIKDGEMLGSFKRFLHKELKKHEELNRNCVLDHGEYDFRHGIRGIAVVISNGNFATDSDYKMEARTYADTELRKMNEMFSGLGFIVMLFKDLTAQQMYDVIETVSSEKMDFFLERSDAFACVLASHGNEVQEENPPNPNIVVYNHVLYGTDQNTNMTHCLMDLLNENRCRMLKGKPKLFFIQACRSRFNDPSRYDEGVDTFVKDTSEGLGFKWVKKLFKMKDEHARQRDELESITTVKTPCHNDFLVMYSTSQGTAGFGREKEGGWLLHVMHRIMMKRIEFIREHKDDRLDFLIVMTEVMKNICFEFGTDTGNPATSGRKTAPTLQHKLSSDLIFRNKYIS